MNLIIASILACIAVKIINSALYVAGRAWQWIQAARFERWLETH